MNPQMKTKPKRKKKVPVTAARARYARCRGIGVGRLSSQRGCGLSTALGVAHRRRQV
jgi:hypothetical protein